jgi:hypothetical protein
VAFTEGGAENVVVDAGEDLPGGGRPGLRSSIIAPNPTDVGTAMLEAMNR